MKTVPVHLVLLFLAMQVPLPTSARPGTRHSRQDLRMLPANSTGTPQDQALAIGVVLLDADQAPAPDVGPTKGPAKGPAKGPTNSTAAALSSSSSSSTAATLTPTAPSLAGAGAAGLRKTPLSSSVAPVHAQERTKYPGATSDNIVFPSPEIKPDVPTQQKFAPVPSRVTPACAHGSTFCTDFDDYPESYLQTILQSANVGLGLRGYFGNDVIAESNITQRIDANDEYPLCPYEETVVYPKVAKNKEDKWLYIVNHDQYVQGVRIESCQNAEGTPCQMAESFPFGYTTSCRQKYIFRRLVALKPEGKPDTDMFRLPSCCSCYVTRSVSSRSNMTPAIRKTGSRKR